MNDRQRRAFEKRWARWCRKPVDDPELVRFLGTGAERALHQYVQASVRSMEPIRAVLLRQVGELVELLEKPGRGGVSLADHVRRDPRLLRGERAPARFEVVGPLSSVVVAQVGAIRWITERLPELADLDVRRLEDLAHRFSGEPPRRPARGTRPPEDGWHTLRVGLAYRWMRQNGASLRRFPWRDLADLLRWHGHDVGAGDAPERLRKTVERGGEQLTDLAFALFSPPGAVARPRRSKGKRMLRTH